MPSAQAPATALTRRRNDHVLIEQLNRSNCPIRVSAHRSTADARAGRDPVAVGETRPPAAYRATFEFDTLIGPGKRHRPTVMVIDPLAHNGYPATEPVATVIGEAPWTPHFTNGIAVCHGHRFWIPNRTQLVDYVIHLGRLLNFDEPPPDASYAGYNRAAIDWWRKELRYGPLDPTLRFPTIEPTEVLARGRSGATRMRRTGEGGRPPGQAQARKSRLRAARG